MQLNTQTIAWIAVSLLILLVIAYISLPFITEGTTSIMTRFETVTSGGDWTPPSSWGEGGN